MNSAGRDDELHVSGFELYGEVDADEVLCMRDHDPAPRRSDEGTLEERMAKSASAAAGRLILEDLAARDSGSAAAEDARRRGRSIGLGWLIRRRK